MGKRAKPEEIIAKLREVEVRLARGETAAAAARAVGVTEQSYYRWRKEYGGLQVDQAKRMKDLDTFIVVVSAVMGTRSLLKNVYHGSSRAVFSSVCQIDHKT